MSEITILPVNENLIVTTYANIAHLQSIFDNNYYDKYMLNNYIQLFYSYNEIDKHCFTFYANTYETCKFVEYNTYYWGFETVDDGLINLLIEKIEEGYYIIIELNELYVPNRDPYCKYHRQHANFIYGYSKNKQIFNTKGYLDRQFIPSTITFDEIVKAYKTIDHDLPIRFIKLNNTNYEIDWGKITYDFEEYLNSGQSEQMHGKGVLFGIDVVSKFIGVLCNSKGGEKYNDIRPISIIKDQKNSVLKKIYKLNDMRIINLPDDSLNTFNDIYNTCVQCLNLHIKYNITNDSKHIMKIIDNLERIIEQERSILPAVIKQLNEHLHKINWSKPLGFNEEK